MSSLIKKQTFLLRYELFGITIISIYVYLYAHILSRLRVPVKLFLIFRFITAVTGEPSADGGGQSSRKSRLSARSVPLPAGAGRGTDPERSHIDIDYCNEDIEAVCRELFDDATPHLHSGFVPFTTGSERGLEARRCRRPPPGNFKAVRSGIRNGTNGYSPKKNGLPP